MSKMHHPLIEIYPMRYAPDGEGSIIADGRDIPAFYDVLVRFEGDDPLEEFEGIKTYAEAMLIANCLVSRFPGSPIVEIDR
ncbi:hypothetical protein [Brucella anthropi]|uniref:hypothetical protein n=1 Tax=Brucella anthropi TaxID=529 RepID=UPI000F668B36|nr:hypothetical protein [Brucella anthropi]RRY03855.1 hypothetical protein EGJ58_22405 [Brucella anthropi]